MQTATSDIRTDIVVKCPATGEVVGRVAVTSAAEVEAVAVRLRAAQPAWQRLGVEGRAKWLGKWRDWLLDHSDQLHTLVQLEGGKSWGDTASEMLLGTQVVNYWIDNAAEFLADQSVRPSGAANAAKKLTVVYEPYQLVGVITPWNGPLAGPLLDIPAALMAGCAVLSKPSEYAPLAWDRGALEHRGRRDGSQPLHRAPNRLEHQEIRPHRTPLSHRSRSEPADRSSPPPTHYPTTSAKRSPQSADNLNTRMSQLGLESVSQVR